MHYSESELSELFGSVGEDVRVHKSCIVIGGGADTSWFARATWIAFIAQRRRARNLDRRPCSHRGGRLSFRFGREDKDRGFRGISARSLLYTATDDYIHGHLTGPTVAAKYRKVTTGDLILKKHCIIGCGSVIMPCTLGVGASVGALSFCQ